MTESNLASSVKFAAVFEEKREEREKEKFSFFFDPRYNFLALLKALSNTI